jgi:pilus assembly protein CpaD
MRSRPLTRSANVLMGKIIMSQNAARSRAAALGAVLAAAALVAGCRTDSDVTASLAPSDYRVRHPIALTYAPNTLDLFISRNMTGLDARQAEDLKAFAAEYRRSGRGPMTVLVPVEPNAPAASRRGADAVRTALAAAGVSRTYLQVQSYPGPSNSLASPVRLVFSKLQAKVTSECGQFRTDIGGTAGTLEGWQNRDYYNFGCASQTALANQVADPIDLQRARVEERSDVVKRMKVFDDARKGTDPSTTWKTEAAAVSGTGQ